MHTCLCEVTSAVTARSQRPGEQIPECETYLDYWVLVKGSNLSYHNKETILFIYYRSLFWYLKLNSLARTQLRV